MTILASNLVRIRDARIGAEWPDGHRPPLVDVMHDALYRVAQVDYRYRQDDGRYGDRDRATDWRDEQAYHKRADPMRRDPAPMVPALPEHRPANFTYTWDWLANQTEWTDDSGAFYERSLGRDLLNGHAVRAGATDARPTALYFASHILSVGDPDPGIERGGWLRVDYGEGGNVVGLTVRGQCHDRSARPTAPRCLDPGGADPDARATALAAGCVCEVEQHYRYRWDELDRLSEARRYDRGTGRGDWTLQVRQRYRYDAANGRTIKETRDRARGGELARAALYVYAGYFERRGVQQAAAGDGWAEGSLPVESQYLVGGARITWNDVGVPAPGDRTFDKDARVTYALTDLIQTTSAVLDLYSGQLVESGTHYPNGARESLRTERRERFSLEPMGFTGKEGDDEVGLVYFGERYLMSYLGRWASPDPLQVHAGGGGEFGNSYHYVSGNLLQARDPLGLQGFLEQYEQAAEIAAEMAAERAAAEAAENRDAAAQAAGEGLLGALREAVQNGPADGESAAEQPDHTARVNRGWGAGLNSNYRLRSREFSLPGGKIRGRLGGSVTIGTSGVTAGLINVSFGGKLDINPAVDARFSLSGSVRLRQNEDGQLVASGRVRLEAGFRASVPGLGGESDDGEVETGVYGEAMIQGEVEVSVNLTTGAIRIEGGVRGIARGVLKYDNDTLGISINKSVEVATPELRGAYCSPVPCDQQSDTEAGAPGPGDGAVTEELD